MTNDNLQRFLDAQSQCTPYEQVLKEIQQGKKQSDWMWYIFPQIKGLGKSQIPKQYAIADLAEAEAYFRHPILGARLSACAMELVKLQYEPNTKRFTESNLSQTRITAENIFGEVDAKKLQASITLFLEASLNCLRQKNMELKAFKYERISYSQRRKPLLVLSGLYFNGGTHKETLRLLGLE